MPSRCWASMLTSLQSQSWSAAPQRCEQPCSGGCNPVQPTLQPCASHAATLRALGRCARRVRVPRTGARGTRRQGEGQPWHMRGQIEAHRGPGQRRRAAGECGGCGCRGAPRAREAGTGLCSGRLAGRRHGGGARGGRPAVAHWRGHRCGTARCATPSSLGLGQADWLRAGTPCPCMCQCMCMCMCMCTCTCTCTCTCM